MKEKLDIKTKIYFLNLLYYILIFIALVLILGLGSGEGHFDLLGGYVVASLFAVIYLGHTIAIKFSRSA
ncbi:MAG TPA: hypothetical protein VFK07_00145 [Candidatus Paceibacterota bacterium]|nr:hypothetical protein [Candidatus Paceibacterota bacterium]